MPQLLVVAASGLAREVLEVVRLAGSHTVVGCLDDDPRRHDTELADGVPVLGGLDLVAEFPDAQLVVCAGKGSARDAIVGRLDLSPSRFATVRHPGVDLPGSCRLGPGSILLGGVTMTADVEIGSHVVAMPGVVLTHDDRIGDYATLCAGVVAGGGVRIGERAYVGMSATLRERVVVGHDAVVGMAAAVLSDVPAGETWVGVPARRLHAGDAAVSQR